MLGNGRIYYPEWERKFDQEMFNIIATFFVYFIGFVSLVAMWAIHFVVTYYHKSSMWWIISTIPLTLFVIPSILISLVFLYKFFRSPKQ